MGRSRIIVAVTAAAAAGLAGVALAGGGPPPTPPASDPPAFTVVTTASAGGPVEAPYRQTNESINRVVRAARTRLLGRVLATARTEAVDLGAASGLRPLRIVAVRRDVSPPGYWGQGRWRDPSGKRSGAPDVPDICWVRFV